MCGVDLLDSHLGRYKIKLKSKKWYMRIYYHLLDLTVCNSWLLYKYAKYIFKPTLLEKFYLNLNYFKFYFHFRRAKLQMNDNKNLLNLADFKSELAVTLCNMVESSRMGRPSSLQSKLIESKRKKTTASPIPPKETRLDGLNHWPKWALQRQRCKNPQCKYMTFCECEKCQLAFCFNKDRNCFRQFHK